MKSDRLESMKNEGFRHKKVYMPLGGVKLMCGDMEHSSYDHDANWMLKGCRFCGMDVRTTGSSPATTRIFEGDTVPTVLEVFKMILMECQDNIKE